MNYLFRLIIIGACVAVFVMLISPRYKAMQEVREEIGAYDASLATAERLKTSREELIAKYNSISKSDLDGIKTLLPESVDNIRLIIQLDALATKNGLSSLRNVDYKAEDTSTQAVAPRTSGVAASANQLDVIRRPYGEMTVSFQTTGQYRNFLAFISDLEQNLRLVDVTSVDFALTPSTSGAASSVADIMSYRVTLKTYWLKQ